MTMADGSTTDVYYNGVPSSEMHDPYGLARRFDELLADRVHEFLFVFTPLRLKGATGSPGRPLAIR